MAAARAASSVAALSRRKDSISDELSTVSPAEVPGLRLGEAVKAVAIDFLPPFFDEESFATAQTLSMMKNCIELHFYPME